MIYADLIRNFAARTVENLKIIEGSNPSGARGELTQLVNSLYGVVIMPTEKALRYLPKTKFKKMQADGWPQFSIIKDINDECVNLRRLIVVLRNGAAHAKLKFADTDGDGHVDVVTITNKYKSRKYKTHVVVRFTAANLRDFVVRFAELLQKPGMFPATLQ